ncbi:DUF2577 domain-containing protein [Clostridium thermopalmarium]|uniref:DUF2577 domain-containing protein n=1 Tax=Clostridium thermopalmarium DSM 5974 TaxID=1121340 RepID=A0A2T0API1_9CLOT|nr:DUF2577 domain-containing protein [Clostridium thermopalmarium]PRR70927.1 hypothetical protein CPAL_20170 [Clostridium thermopalmarium DSM 5974]PVZ28851.1 uncharacterized protein DUF2577 [Clostridium thermopalmarium DSM 5974]
MKDPYVEFINLMKDRGADKNPPSIQIGQMVSANILKIGELQLTSDDFYVADYLKENYKRNLEVDGSTREYITKDGLKAGDTVAVLATEDRQTFIVLCKVDKP